MKVKFFASILYTSLFSSLIWTHQAAMGSTKESEQALAQPTTSHSKTPHFHNKQHMAAVSAEIYATEHLQDFPRFYLHKITLRGAKFLSNRAKKRLLKPYLHQLVDAKQINQLANAVQAYYIEQGYPTTQVKVRIGQNLQAGELKIDVQIGFIEDIILNGHSARDRGKIATAFLWSTNRPLYLPYLEQGLDQLNSVSSSRATLRILPGLQEGGSVIYIDQEMKNPVRLVIGADNLGKKESGPWRWKYHADIDNLLSINDTLAVHYDINHAKVVSDQKLRSYHWMFKYSFPLGPLKFSTNHSIGSEIVPIKASNYLSIYTQTKYNQQYEIKFPLYKYTGYKGTMLINFNHSQSNNILKNTRINNQSKPETQGKVETSHTGIIYQGAYSLTLSYEQGLAWLGAEVDNDQPAPGVLVAQLPKRQFKKVNWHGAWSRPFSLFKQFFDYQIDCAGQYSQDEIISSHQLSLTGAEHVRGFSENYTGNQGIYFKQEISWKHLLPFHRWLFPLNLVAGIDIGYLPRRSNTDPKNAKLPLVLASASVICQYHVSWWSIDFSYAKPLYINQGWGKIDTQGKLYISCNLHLHELARLGRSGGV